MNNKKKYLDDYLAHRIDKDYKELKEDQTTILKNLQNNELFAASYEVALTDITHEQLFEDIRIWVIESWGD